MKANYLPKNRLRHTYFKRILILVAIFISGAFIFSFLDVAFISIFSPIWKAEKQINLGFGKTIAFLNSKKSLVAENAMLKEKLYSLETEALALSMGQIQKDILLELVGRKENSGAVAAAVLTRPPQTPYDIIVIDAGSNESITVGSEVLLPEGSILGVVSEVFPTSAKVKLFSANGQETNAILERGSVPITLVGIGGGNFRFAFPREISIERGDRIFSADITARHLATVGEVSVEPADSFKEVLAEGPSNIFSLRFVFITP